MTDTPAFTKGPGELIEKLSSPATVFYEYAADNGALLREAAAALRASAERERRLREALEPFAKYYDLNDCIERDDSDALDVPIRDLRRAFAALAAAKGESDA